MKNVPVLFAATVLASFGQRVIASDLSLESAPPVVVKTVPVAGATDVEPGLTEIRVTYSKAMEDGNWSWSTWGEENYPETTGKPRYLADSRTCVLPVKLQAQKFYAIWLNSDKFKNFKDTGSKPAVPYLLTFFTGGELGRPETTGGRGLEHTVQTGETLSQIVNSYRQKGVEVTVDEVLKANPGLNPAALKVGQRIYIPTKSSPDSAKEIQSATRDDSGGAPDRLLNDDQRAVLAWTDRQFRSFFDERTFGGWSEQDRTSLEKRCLDALNGPRTREYYEAISTLGALRSTNALPRLREIAFERVDRNNRDRWMCVRVLGLMDDRQSVPDLIHLVYHGNQNTHWWAQISLVRLTGQNFGGDWNAWGKWWNDRGRTPAYNPEIIRWWNGQPEPDKLAAAIKESDQKFLDGIRPKTTAPNTVEQRGQALSGEQYLQQQRKDAQAGNYWAKFRVWQSYSQGSQGVAKNPVEADKWLAELAGPAYLAKFEPVNGFNPRTPREMLDEFSAHSQLRSGSDSLGGASFFRTTKRDSKLIGSFLTATPDEFKAEIEKNPNLKLISIEKVTPKMFLEHQASPQESL